MAVERSEEKSYPTKSITKEDLIYARPDLEEIIEELSDEKMEQIADKVGDHITDEHWWAIDEVLNRTFGAEEDELNESFSDNEDNDQSL